MSSTFTKTSYCNSPLNNSKTKMQYSFSKERRFSKDFQLVDKFYDIPSRRSNRTCSMGFGQKTLTLNISQVKNPSPFDYDVSKSFQFQQNPNPFSTGYSFGLSRDACDNLNMYSKKRLKPELPSPQKYEQHTPRSKIAYTMRNRTPTPDQKYSYQFTPGPKYNNITSFSPVGRYIVSSYRTHQIPIINPKSKKEKSILINYNNIPGPGKYEPAQTMTQTGKYVLSKLKSSKARTFGKDAKLKFQPSKNPAPGVYNTFSQFGN